MSPAADTLTLRRPDDWHVHLRDGPFLRAVIGFTAERFAKYCRAAAATSARPAGAPIPIAANRFLGPPSPSGRLSSCGDR